MKYIILALVVLGAMAFDADRVDRAGLYKFGVNITEELYSGYLPVNDDGSAQFHYYFVLSDESKPLTLWLNGGPGCSSAQGLFNENGPVHFVFETAQLVNNQYSWSKTSNMLYLESPIGVGFSYGPDQEQTDESTAQYNLRAIQQFLKKFPQFANSEFYISGESYAGVYIPTLASAILDYNAAGGKINLKGLLIGNGCTHPSECASPFPQHIYNYYGRQNLISEKTFEAVQKNVESCVKNYTDACQAIDQQINAEFEGYLYINPYNVFGKCPVYRAGNSIPNKNARAFMSNPQLRDGDDVPPCADVKGLFTYLRNPEFMKLLHVPEGLPKWGICSSINYNGKFSSYHLYPKLMKAGLRIWKFSGDGDAVVPITGTLYWVELIKKEQNLKTIVNWRPWFVDGTFDSTRQNAGSFYKLDGLTFVSVRGAGHMVPTDQRASAQVLFENFIKNTDLPSS